MNSCTFTDLMIYILSWISHASAPSSTTAKGKNVSTPNESTSSKTSPSLEYFKASVQCISTLEGGLAQRSSDLITSKPGASFIYDNCILQTYDWDGEAPNPICKYLLDQPLYHSFQPLVIRDPLIPHIVSLHMSAC